MPEMPRCTTADAMTPRPPGAARLPLAVCNLTAAWTISSARDLAWRNRLLRAVRDLPPARAMLCDSIAEATALAGRMLLVTV